VLEYDAGLSQLLGLRRKTCRRWRRLEGSLAIHAGPGKNVVHSNGRLRGKPLKRGTYRLTGSATTAGGTSRAVHLRIRLR
jgi:hypothetical protein